MIPLQTSASPQSRMDVRYSVDSLGELDHVGHRSAEELWGKKRLQVKSELRRTWEQACRCTFVLRL